jgi:hypothetical protein
MTGTLQPDVFVEEALRWSSTTESQKVWHVWRWNDEQHKTTAIAVSEEAARSLARQWAADAGCRAWFIAKNGSLTEIE